MRCRIGDIAVIVAPRSRNYGRLVEVIGVNYNPEAAMCDWETKALGRLWDYASGQWCEPGAIGASRDAELRPLRDGPGPDETFNWTTTPTEATA